MSEASSSRAYTALIERGRGDRVAIPTARDVLTADGAVAIFPQGAVRATGSWQRGAAKPALATGAPVLPVRLIGTAAALSSHRIGLRRLRVIVGTALVVAPAPATVAAARELTEQLRAAVEGLEA